MTLLRHNYTAPLEQDLLVYGINLFCFQRTLESNAAQFTEVNVPSSSPWTHTGSNRRPPECKSGALPTELQPQIGVVLHSHNQAPESLQEPDHANCSRGQLDVPPRALKAAPHSKISYLSKKESRIVNRNDYRLLSYLQDLVGSQAPVVYRRHFSAIPATFSLKRR